MILDIQAVKRDKPWNYLYLQKFFQEETYLQIINTLPKIECCRILKSSGYRRIYPLADSKLKFWKTLNEEMCSPDLQDTLFKLMNIKRKAFPKVSIIRDLPGYSIRPHPDATFKVATIHVYLPSTNEQHLLGTRLIGKNFIKQLGFFPNTGIAFEVMPSSWHEVPTPETHCGIRDSIMICYFDTLERKFE